ncbi:nuclease [Massilia glaciei]|uniref:Nuclease n=2 Tax=Massilia glaciei TaxID=1524097 RepID=A0A2U2HC85_9BURK|nr:nuclease [Massilia glaciei]
MMSKRDTLAIYQSEHKTEVNYDMTKDPPVPIMDFETKTMVHRWAPGWIKKNWNADPTHPLWLPGEGYVRRPDVVIVNDPTKPPTQDNIKQVVEIKFDDDDWGILQAESYEIISGRGKLALLTPKMCSCDDPDRKKRTADLKNEELVDELEGMLDIVANKGRRGGRRPRLPKKLPNLKD